MSPELVADAPPVSCLVCAHPLEETGRAVPPALYCGWCGSDAE